MESFVSKNCLFIVLDLVDKRYQLFQGFNNKDKQQIDILDEIQETQLSFGSQMIRNVTQKCMKSQLQLKNQEQNFQNAFQYCISLDILQENFLQMPSYLRFQSNQTEIFNNKVQIQLVFDALQVAKMVQIRNDAKQQQKKLETHRFYIIMTVIINSQRPQRNLQKKKHYIIEVRPINQHQIHNIFYKYVQNIIFFIFSFGIDKLYQMHAYLKNRAQLLFSQRKYIQHTYHSVNRANSASSVFDQMNPNHATLALLSSKQDQYPYLP